ncbi:MAG: UvrB/UvrC motif-containing protein, partial [Tannerellaceae bacterium]
REKQMAYNEAHGIQPRQVQKNSTSVLGKDIKATEPKAYVEPTTSSVAADPVVQYMTKPQLEKAIGQTKKAMQEAAKKLEFLEAAQLRDELVKLEELLTTKY